jgi:hypothetical protein
MLGLVVSPTAKEKKINRKIKQKLTEPLHCKQKMKKA